MTTLHPEFEEFFALWKTLPRRRHALLPCKQDITPSQFGKFLQYMAIAERKSPNDCRILFAGSMFELNAGFPVTGRNYYAMLPPAFIKPMKAFHRNLLGTPCGAYIADVISTTSGHSYIHHTLQLPAVDEKGFVRYLLACGLAKQPFHGAGSRTESSDDPAYITDLIYINLGSGVPGAQVADFVYRTA
jgi:hypothetical protein